MGGDDAHHMVTVPASIRRAKGWGKGQELRWEVNDDGDLVLKEE